MENDTKFLEKNGICDYSFLIGFHFISETERELIEKLEKYPVEEYVKNNRLFFMGVTLN